MCADKQNRLFPYTLWHMTPHGKGSWVSGLQFIEATRSSSFLTMLGFVGEETMGIEFDDCGGFSVYQCRMLHSVWPLGFVTTLTWCRFRWSLRMAKNRPDKKPAVAPHHDLSDFQVSSWSPGLDTLREHDPVRNVFRKASAAFEVTFQTWWERGSSTLS